MEEHAIKQRGDRTWLLHCTFPNPLVFSFPGGAEDVCGGACREAEGRQNSALALVSVCQTHSLTLSEIRLSF